MKKVSGLLVATVAAVGLASPAVANGGNVGDFPHPMSNSDDSAEFHGGSWSFDSWPGTEQHPGFYYWGQLQDSQQDGDWVYTRGRVDGYDWGGGSSAENHDGYPTMVAVSQKVWGADPPHEAQIQVCRHRVSFLPNICSESGWKIARNT
jgi:hypothetical protein